MQLSQQRQNHVLICPLNTPACSAASEHQRDECDSAQRGEAATPSPFTERGTGG